MREILRQCVEIDAYRHIIYIVGGSFRLRCCRVRACPLTALIAVASLCLPCVSSFEALTMSFSWRQQHVKHTYPYTPQPSAPCRDEAEDPAEYEAGFDADIDIGDVAETYTLLLGCGVGGVVNSLGHALETLSFELLAQVRGAQSQRSEEL